MITATQQLENYLESFTEFEELAVGHDLPWLRKLRRDAFARFCEVGFPTPHDEDWRFTNVSAIAQTPFRLAWNALEVPANLYVYHWRSSGPLTCIRVPYPNVATVQSPQPWTSTRLP